MAAGSIKGVAAAIATIEWIIFVAMLVLTIVYSSEILTRKRSGMSMVSLTAEDDYYALEAASSRETGIFIATLTIILVISFSINLLLTVGIVKGNSTCCKIWYIINIICAGLLVVTFAISLWVVNPIRILLNSVALVYRIIAVGTIIKYAHELETSNPQNGHVYSRGHTPQVIHGNAVPGLPRLEMEIQSQPYHYQQYQYNNQ